MVEYRIMESSNITPLFVDLDGTFVKTDLLFESFMSSFKDNPLIVFYCFFWLLKGIPYLKNELSKNADINVEKLPINPELLAFLLEEKSKGRKIYLATASNEKYAKLVVECSDVFDGYLSSTESINLKGKNKLNRIKEISSSFSYAGNDGVDFDIFADAKEKILVNPSRSARLKSASVNFDKTFDLQRAGFMTWVNQLRIHQWLKNLLIIVPLVVSGKFGDLNSIVTITMAFFAFSLLASSTYILNDLLDLESDRNHVRKKNRPLAAGLISIKQGIISGCILFFTAVLISWYVGPEFSLVLVAYLVLTLLYSFKIKKYVGMDVVCLALLYTLRIIAGAAAISVLVSFWLFAFSIFIFLSLALVKRCSEIQTMQVEGKVRASGRDYTIDDYAVLKSFGTSTAMLAVLMFCFYINNSVLTNQYQQPNILWLIVPALCYWLMRVWIKTHRGEMHDDPIVFSLKDRGSLVTIIFCGFVAILAQLV